MCQVPIKLKSKEANQLKRQRNCQIPRQEPHKLIYQIDLRKYPRVCPRYMPSIITVRYSNKEPNTSLGFGDSSEDPSVSTSDHPTKDPSQVPIIKLFRTSSEIPTKDTSYVLKEFLSNNQINMPIESSSGYLTGDTITIPTDKQISNPIA